jgi:DoxX-like family
MTEGEAMRTTIHQNPDQAERPSRTRSIVYWAVSLPVLAETAAGIQWDFSRHPTVVKALATIRFPDYMADILGTVKILALIALLVPRLPRLKEWAYAGLTFVYLGAASCHVAVHDSVGAILAPAILGIITLASWVLRPASRRDPMALPQAWRALTRTN